MADRGDPVAGRLRRMSRLHVVCDIRSSESRVNKSSAHFLSITTLHYALCHTHNMTYCRVCYSDASLVCSGCKTDRYCSYVQLTFTHCDSEKCQSQDWKDGHKKICKFQQVINEAEAKAKADLEPPERPATGRCTGCNASSAEATIVKTSVRNAGTRRARAARRITPKVRYF